MEDFLPLFDFAKICRNKAKLYLRQKERRAVLKARKILQDAVGSNKAYYAINTGVGALFDERIPLKRMSEFQKNLVVSHACGVGKPVEKEITKGMMLHMIFNLKKGYSGIRLETLELLIEMFNEDIIPVVPEKGSLGASGDLIPQAHIALAMIGKGDIWHDDDYDGWRSASEVFERHDLEPVKLEAGEAIALLNGTSFMASLMAFTVAHCSNLVKIAHIAAAMSIAALGGDTGAFEQKSQKGSYHSGRETSAYVIAELLCRDKFSCDLKKLQEAYSLRCAPRVFGNFLETFYYHVRRVVSEEINNFSGNPEIFPEKELVEQGRDNFHGQSLAQVADSLSIALASMAGISERRVEKLLNGSSDKLPLFLTKKPGLNSGFMIAQYTAAALVAENRMLASPASVHSISVAAGQEDFVSMGALAARKVWEICKNTEYVIGIELLCAAQALDFRKSAYLKNSNIRKIHKIVREHVSYMKKDRFLAEDIKDMFDLIHDSGEEFLKKVYGETGTYFNFRSRILGGD